MRPNRRFFLGGGVAFTAAALVGCTSPPTNYYRLASIPGAVLGDGPMTISVRSINIPGYLDQNNIIKPGGAYALNSFNNALWAEPFADMLRAVMVQDLSQRLPRATIVSAGAIGAPADYIVEIDVQRFDFDPSGNINATAQFAVKPGAAGAAWITQKFQADAAPPSSKVTSIIEVMSQLWAKAADRVGAMVV